MSLQQYLALWRWESEHTFINPHTNEPGLGKEKFNFHQIRRLPSYSRSPLNKLCKMLKVFFLPVKRYQWLTTVKINVIVAIQYQYQYSISNNNTVYQSKTCRPKTDLWLAKTLFSMTQGSKVNGVLKNLGNSLYDGHWNFPILTMLGWDNWV